MLLGTRNRNTGQDSVRYRSNSAEVGEMFRGLISVSFLFFFGSRSEVCNGFSEPIRTRISASTVVMKMEHDARTERKREKRVKERKGKERKGKERIG